MDARDLGWSKRLRGMRDLKEDMYNSDIWLGMPGLGDRKISRQRRDSGRRHKVTRTAQIPI